MFKQTNDYQKNQCRRPFRSWTLFEDERKLFVELSEKYKNPSAKQLEKADCANKATAFKLKLKIKCKFQRQAIL